MRIPIIALLLLLLLTAPAAGALDTNYHIGDGDVLRISVYDHPDLSTTTRVNSDGTLFFPLIGSVPARGLTIGKLADNLSRRLSDGYLVNPQVTIFVEEFRSQKATVIGQVKNPGLYELSGPTTLMQLLSKAGGINQDASETVTIKRQSDGADGEEEIIVNLQELREGGDQSSDIAIQDGDSIFIDRAGIFYVTGEVKKPDAYQFERGISVITAITRAGGFTDLAAKGKVRIIRKIEGSEKVLNKVPMHEPILPNDVVVVPESFF